jgi:biopolymer transport protein ExbB
MLLAVIDIMRILRETGWYLGIPLAICFTIAVFVIIERCYALRLSAVVPEHLSEAVIEGKTSGGDHRSTLGRIMVFAGGHVSDTDATKAFARLEVSKLERGVSFLDTIYAAAPLLGLIGTVTGLLQAFSVVDPETRMPDPVKFTESVGYALSATVLGLCVALIALIGSGYLQRVIDKRAAHLDLLLERVLARRGGGATPGSPPIVSGGHS